MDANVDWMILSQCDCQIVRDLVAYDNREAKNVGLRTTRNFYKWIQTKKPWHFISTSMKHNMYPVWLSILQLPPILRVSKKNIALGALWVGEGKPDWKLVTTHLEQELKRIVAVNFPSEKTVFLKFTVSFIVCDLIAKPSVLNMFQHNGFYGCNFCDHPGVTIDGSHAYYPQKITHKNKRYQVPWEIRDSNLHESYVGKAENLKREGRTGINVVGVKGRSEFSRLVKGTYQT